MRMPSRKHLLGAAALVILGAGVAEAASSDLKTLHISAPDGSTIEVHYIGDVAPKVEVVPASNQVPAAQVRMLDPFAEMDRISAMMDMQMHAMMQRAAMLNRQAAQMQQEAIAHDGDTAGAPGITLVSNLPRGVHMSYSSTTIDANGCARTVSYSSDGSDAAPKVTKAASDGCDATATTRQQAIPAKAEAPTATEAKSAGQRI